MWLKEYKGVVDVNCKRRHPILEFSEESQDHESAGKMVLNCLNKYRWHLKERRRIRNRGRSQAAAQGSWEAKPRQDYVEALKRAVAVRYEGCAM